ncbi:MAG: type III-A CRISPR-associated protein Cas10/Csm1 [Anaerolineae bacterium]|jgi:CRISPR-associated protein Csm1|nr:type III-A CRISPR-associated protein Cas10/Csm1 [Anaerolineae bacterium]
MPETTPTQKAISAFLSGAKLKDEPLDLPNIFQEIKAPTILKSLEGKKPNVLPEMPLTTENAPLYLENLLLWGEKNLGDVPSADPYVSLYEVGRLSAALACVGLDATVGADSAPLSLIAGDLSGVQDFIYTITAKGAVSALRGRSLYLQLLTEAIARYMLKELDLPISNLLYMGGGQFHILAGEIDKDKLAKIRLRISKTLLKYHQGTLSLILAKADLKANELSGESLREKRKELNENLQNLKKRPFSELGKEIYPLLFEPQGHGGNEESECSVCGMEDKRTEVINEETNTRKCPACLSYEDLGRDLRKANYLVINAGELENPDEEYKKVLHAFGFSAKFRENLPKDEGKKEIILAINKDALKNLKASEKRAVGRRHLVNLTPLATGEEDYEAEEGERKPEKDEIKPFKMLSESAQGIERLGVLRMDVDNLGTLFESESSLGRINMLSARIAQFFEGEIEEIAKKIEGDNLYSIYSGGDDLFFVGAWDAVVELSIAIREALSEIKGIKPKIHASAGIVLISNKYPLAQAAVEAGEAEQKSKSLSWGEEGKKTKDAITFLGQTFPWENFSLGENTVKDMKAQINDLLEDNAAKGPIYNLLRLYTQYQNKLKERQERKGDSEDNEGREQDLWGSWMWLGYYYLKRNKSEKVRDLGEQLKKSGDFKAMGKVGVATRWAMLLNRTQGE